MQLKAQHLAILSQLEHGNPVYGKTLIKGSKGVLNTGDLYMWADDLRRWEMISAVLEKRPKNGNYPRAMYRITARGLDLITGGT